MWFPVEVYEEHSRVSMTLPRDEPRLQNRDGIRR